MSNQIEFSWLHNNTPEILDEASKENSSELLNYRLVSPSWCAHCETLLRTLWNKLMEKPLKGIVDILLNMSRINTELSGEQPTVLINFKKLANVFKNLGNNPLAISLPIRINDFQLLQNEIHDNDLKAVWGRLHNSLIAIPTVRPINAGAREIRAFLNDPNNSVALAAVQAFDLSGINLNVVPPEIGRLSGLRNLNLSNNRLKEVPNFNLPNLTQLGLHNNQLTQVPNFNLQNLTYLDLDNNQLKEVPNFNLQNLTYLDLANNQLKEVPNFNLQNLTYLDLANNQLKEVPNFNLQNLTNLILDANQLKEVPNFNLQSLTHLYLHNNQLKEVPNFNLQNLTHLGLYNNQLAQVPNFNLQNLTHLGLYNNQLAQVPNFNLQNLTHLGLGNNQLKEVPNFNLQSLTHLYLQNNQLTQAPNFNSPSLTLLSFTGNMLMDIPEALLKRFPTSPFAQLFHSQITYECQSPLALLYQTIIANKSLEEQNKAFGKLSQADKNLISKIGYEIAMHTAGSFDSVRQPYFNIAVQKAIVAKFERLSNEEKDQVCRETHHLADSPQIQDSPWDAHRAKEHLPRLADLLSRMA